MPPPSLLLIVDSSASMSGPAGRNVTKMQAAKRALFGFVRGLPSDARVGLRVYGNGSRSTPRRLGCRQTELVVPVREPNRRRMYREIRRFQARGAAPIGLSLRRGKADLPESGTRAIVLVSDGVDTCGAPPPCKVARSIKRAAPRLRIHTVGLRVASRGQRSLRCIARVGGGRYAEANDASRLSGQLREIARRALWTYEPQGIPTIGASAPGDAPYLGAGHYADEEGVAADEARYYAVEVQAGQTMQATVTVIGNPRRGIAERGLLHVAVVNELLGGALLSGGPVEAFTGQQAVTSVVETPVVGLGDSPSPFARPGTYLVVLDLGGGSDLAEARFPVELEIAVEGEPLSTPASSSPAVALPTAPETGGGGDGDGFRALLLVVGAAFFGVLGALFGAAVVSTAGRRR